MREIILAVLVPLINKYRRSHNYILRDITTTEVCIENEIVEVEYACVLRTIFKSTTDISNIVAELRVKLDKYDINVFYWLGEYGGECTFIFYKK